MKWILKFLSWYIFMWIAIIPIDWYFIGYFNANFDLVHILSLIIQGLIILGVIFNHSFRLFIWGQLRFIYNLIGQIEEISERKRINRLKKKDYVYIK